MQSLFVNVGKSTGATIISAAAGTQFALERNDLKNGVFTYSILEAMNKYPTMKISELKKIVGERVEQLTKGLQKPTSRNETIAVDWNQSGNYYCKTIPVHTSNTTFANNIEQCLPPIPHTLPVLYGRKQ